MNHQTTIGRLRRTALHFVLAGALIAPVPGLADAARGRLSLGLTSLPVKVSGIENIHISDGFITNPSGAPEGRLALNIAENNTFTLFAPGIEFDAGYSIIPNKLDIVGEVGVNIMEAKVVTIGIGSDVNLLRSDAYRINSSARLGIVGMRIGGTRAQAVDGFAQEVEADFGVMNVNDEIQATLGGMYASLGLVFEYEIFKGIWVKAETSTFQSFLGALRLEAIKESDNDPDDNNSTRTRVPLDSEAIIEPNVDIREPLELKPRGDSLGLSIFLGLSFDTSFSGE